MDEAGCGLSSSGAPERDSFESSRPEESKKEEEELLPDLGSPVSCPVPGSKEESFPAW